MSDDLFDKMTNLIESTEEINLIKTQDKQHLLLSRSHRTPSNPLKPLPNREDFSYAHRTSVPTNSVVNKQVQPEVSPPSIEATEPPKESSMSDPQDLDDKLNALKRLRELPRGTQVDSRIAAIESMLGEVEIYKTLKMLRWPQGVICPRCKSTNVVRRDPPAEAIDQRHFYICLNCKGEGDPSDFDDLTGLPIDDLQSLRSWILCWYLIGFCSVTQIAKALGISLSEVLQIANRGSELAELPEETLSSSKTFESGLKRSKDAAARARVDTDEDYTRSASKSPFKPGFKSKK